MCWLYSNVISINLRNKKRCSFGVKFFTTIKGVRNLAFSLSTIQANKNTGNPNPGTISRLISGVSIHCVHLYTACLHQKCPQNSVLPAKKGILKKNQWLYHQHRACIIGQKYIWQVGCSPNCRYFWRCKIGSYFYSQDANCLKQPRTI